MDLFLSLVALFFLSFFFLLLFIFLMLITFFYFNNYILFYCFFFLFLYFNFLNFYLWLCWVLVSVRGLSPVAASRGHHSSLWCAGVSLLRPLLLRSAGSRRAGSVIVAHGPSCSPVCGIFPDQGSNPCPLHWQADSQPLCHQGSPLSLFFFLPFFLSHVADRVLVL